jgi:LPXTG-motif cell wall-anchored protein
MRRLAAIALAGLVRAPLASAAPATVASSTGSGTPWAFLAAAAGGLVLVVLLLLWLARRRKRARPVTGLEHSAATATADPVVTSAPDEAEPAPERAAAAPAPRDPDHVWDVAYERGELGTDGVWRFPHRCRTCGVQLLARDVVDATAQADASAAP